MAKGARRTSKGQTEVARLLREASAQATLLPGIIDMLQRVGSHAHIPAVAQDAAEAVMELTLAANSSTAAALADMETADEARRKVHRKNAARGGNRQAELHAKAREMFETMMTTHRAAHKGQWPSVADALAMLEAGCRKAKLAAPSVPTVKRWLVDMGRPKGLRVRKAHERR